MALNKQTLKQDIIEILEDMMEREANSIQEFATRLSEAMDNYVKSADVTGVCPSSGGPLTQGQLQ